MRDRKIYSANVVGLCHSGFGNVPVISKNGDGGRNGKLSHIKMSFQQNLCTERHNDRIDSVNEILDISDGRFL